MQEMQILGNSPFCELPILERSFLGFWYGQTLLQVLSITTVTFSVKILGPPSCKTTLKSKLQTLQEAQIQGYSLFHE